MRVTNKMTSDVVLSNILKNQAKLNSTSQKLASGRKINIPQDDPTGAIRAIGYRSNLAEIEQYITNVDSAKGFLESTDVALGQMGNILQRVRELSVEAANDTYEQSSRDAIADEISQLIDEVVGVLNSKVGDRYIFAGYNTLEAPFRKYIGSEDSGVGGPGQDLVKSDGTVRSGINENNITVVEYTGDDGELLVEMDEGITSSYNVSGEDLVKSSAGNLFDILINLRDNIYTSNVSGIEDGIDQIDAATNMILRYRSEVGAKMNRMENVAQRLEDKQINVTDLLSKTEDTDVTETLVDYNVQESVQNMSLSVGARIIQSTLLDFIS